MSDIVPAFSRRDALKILALGGGGLVLAACARPKRGNGAPNAPTTAAPDAGAIPPSPPVATSTRPPGPSAQPDLAGLERLPEGFQANRLTPTDDFYVQSYDGVARPDPAGWRLELQGLVNHPLSLNLEAIRSRAAKTVTRTLECIGNPVGGNLIGNATWRGTSLAALLLEAGLQAEARFLLFQSEDGYETSVPLSLAMDENSLLVYEMNGEALTAAHGSPLRVLLPGVYGQKQPKWLAAIQVTDRNKLGTWERKGWSDQAVIQINSKIETPRLRQYLPAGVVFYITGVAMADTSGVASVELSLDDGRTWHEAALLPGEDTGVWTLWYWLWEDPQPGTYFLLARATDGNGAIQTGSGTLGVLDDVFPNGTSKMHRISIEVN